MITIKRTQISNWQNTFYGMREAFKSWLQSDTLFKYDDGPVAFNVLDEPVQLEGDGFEWEGRGHEFLTLGTEDEKLILKLTGARSSDAKFRRMIHVSAVVTAPLYWWKEYDTYKVGTVANSTSTMHTLHKRDLTLDDFSVENLGCYDVDHEIEDQYYGDTAEPIGDTYCFPLDALMDVISTINWNRKKFEETRDKKFWWQMIQLLPTSFNQERTIDLNYEVLSTIYKDRKNHKLDEWREFCKWIEGLPYADLIIIRGEEEK
jgi:hypothetical protein